MANISPSLLTALNYAAANPGCGIQALAVGLKLATPTISVSVRQLEKAGFLTRQPHPDDGRAVQLFLTPAGQNLHQRTLEFRRPKFGRLLATLTISERTTLLELLGRAVSAVENEEEQGALKRRNFLTNGYVNSTAGWQFPLLF